MSRIVAAEQKNWSFASRVLLPVIAVTLSAVLLVAGGMIWTTRQSDAVSVERQIRSVRREIDASVDQLAFEQQGVAVWDQPLVELAKPQLDYHWFDENIGLWFYQMFGHDEIYILNAQDVPVYASVRGKGVAPDRFNHVRRDVRDLIEAIRGRSRLPNGRHDRNPDKPQAAGATVLTSPDVVHDSHFLLVNGQPAVASAMRMASITGKIHVRPGTEPIVINIRYFDQPFIDRLATQGLIDGLRFSSTPGAQPGEEQVRLTNEHGNVIGYFMWRPELPGTKIIRTLGPLTLVSVLGMIALAALLSRSLRRSMLELQATMVELRASEAQAQHLAFHDVLTGLPNRALFNDRLDQALARARRGEKIAVLALDLDRFKYVNDSFGHQAGDRLIRDLGERLSKVVRASDTIARLGGDEFAIIQTEVGGPEDVEALCKRILEAVAQPFEVLNNQAFVGASIGVALAPAMGSDRIDLMRKADIALYRAKDDGRNCFHYFTTSMDESVKQRSLIEEELRQASATEGALKVFYQPQVGGAGHPIVGVEALLRWQHPTRGLISPEQFIPIAEETGLIAAIGEFVLRQACQASLRWPDLFIAVNLSPVQFRMSGFAERVIEIVRQTGADPRSIELEVTETILLEDDEMCQHALKTLRQAGFRIALDDFGTGYSSLSYLRRFEVDKIKIDRSFVQPLGQKAESAAIVNAVVLLGHAMGLTVSAEGVESPEQLHFLTSAGCNELQGYLFAKALPEESIDALLYSQRARSATSGARHSSAATSPAS